MEEFGEIFPWEEEGPKISSALREELGGVEEVLGRGGGGGL